MLYLCKLVLIMAFELASCCRFLHFTHFQSTWKDSFYLYCAALPRDTTFCVLLCSTIRWLCSQQCRDFDFFLASLDSQMIHSSRIDWVADKATSRKEPISTSATFRSMIHFCHTFRHREALLGKCLTNLRGEHEECFFCSLHLSLDE
jgi:hypothetical protein